MEREGDRYMGDSSGRLGGGGGGAGGGDGIIYKGRGAMKYRDNKPRRW